MLRRRRSFYQRFDKSLPNLVQEPTAYLLGLRWRMAGPVRVPLSNKLADHSPDKPYGHCLYERPMSQKRSSKHFRKGRERFLKL